MTSQYAAVHANPNGPGDARPTALQIVQNEGLSGKLNGKTIFITGCSSGLGVETAKALYTTGATLYLTARDLSKAKTALGSLAESSRVHLLELDLNSLESVRKCAAEFLAQTQTLNIFIANAGVMAIPEGRTKDGFETQLGTNHLAHFLLFNLIKSALLASTTPDFNSRAVILSSVGHRSAEVNWDNINLDGEYNAWVAYGQSKTCNLWTANEIERRYGSQGLHAWSIQPGGVATGLLQHMSEEEKAGLGNDPTLVKIFKSPEQGAATTLWAATAKALEGVGGKYLEDCQIINAWTEADGQWGPGYASWAYDAEKENKLWAKSLEMVGLKDDA
ncbi:short-chain dehydrogenase [Cadophora sp. DSE1049]|nr:short-chain dehydrogenase [Cadophora sp. DSE1049]